MTRRSRLPTLAVLPILVATLGLIALATGEATMQEAPPDAKPCEAGTQKSAVPTKLTLGETAKITLIMTSTCPSVTLPTDIVFVVDKSNSMTEGAGGVIPGPGDPTSPAPVPGDPTPPGSIPFPTQKQPPPTAPVDPTKAPTALHSTAWLEDGGVQRVRGLAQDPIPRPSKVPPTPPSGGPPPTKTPAKPAPLPTDPSRPGPDPTRSLIVRGREEPAGDEDLIREVQRAIHDFLDHMEDDINAGHYRVALVTFNDRARIDVDLRDGTNGASRVRSALSRIRGGGNTRIDLGYSAAQRVLYGVTYRGRKDLDHAKVSILFSDGKADPRTTARLRMRNDVTYLTVAAGRTADIRVMRNLASENEFALDLRNRIELVERVTELPKGTRAVKLTKLTIADKLRPNMELVPGSASPPVTRVLGDGTLEWDFADPSSPVTVTFDVKPLETGVLPVSESAQGMWEDSAARSGAQAFPDVELEVGAVPTAAPSQTAPPEPTATSEARPGAVYLPVTMNGFLACEPHQQSVDVALIIDASISMGDPTRPGGISKIEAAAAAGKSFVSLLKPGDQAAVVGFNERAHVLAPLTAARADLVSALDSLASVQARGTQIDLGIRAGREELAGPGHRPESNRALLLLTDGRQDGGANAAVLVEAEAAKAAGMTVWTVGLGADADQDLLRLAASGPDTYVFAPDAEDLELIYEDIARLIPCS